LGKTDFKASKETMARVVTSQTHTAKDFCQFLQPNPAWNEQTQIDPRWVNMRAALLMHFDFDLAAIH